MRQLGFVQGHYAIDADRHHRCEEPVRGTSISAICRRSRTACNGNRVKRPMSKFTYTVSDLLLERFETDGFVHLPGVVDDEWLELGRGACDRAKAVPTIDGSLAPEYFMKLRVWGERRGFRALRPILAPAPAIAAQLVGSPKMNLLYDQMFNIEPGSGNRTDLHNDLPYWPIRGTQVVTLWLAFDKVQQRENGALEFIRGSHRWQKRYQPYNSGYGDNEPFEGADEPDLVPMPDWNAQRDQLDIVTVEMEPGVTSSPYHALTVHGSPPNVSTDLQRRAYAMRFTACRRALLRRHSLERLHHQSQSRDRRRPGQRPVSRRLSLRACLKQSTVGRSSARTRYRMRESQPAPSCRTGPAFTGEIGCRVSLVTAQSVVTE